MAVLVRTSNKETMKSILFSVLLIVCCGCNRNAVSVNIDDVAIEYIKLGLAIGQYDPDFVDAYYGPDSLRPSTPPGPVIPKDSLIAAIDNLKAMLDKIILSAQSNDTIRMRANWISLQLTSFKGRLRIFTGESVGFDEESLQVFSVKAPVNNEEYYQTLVSDLDELLPGTGTIHERYQNLSKKFTIPKDKVDTVFKTAIAEARKRTMAALQLPEGEAFKLEYVKDKQWGAYNWYKGNYVSLIQINVDLPINIVSAVDWSCHEGYPGHHVYNMMLENKLFHAKGYMEISLYPLFSPQSFIAEGTANYGIEMVFPGAEFNNYIKDVLLPLAGLDTAGVELYLKALSLRKQLNYAVNEVARGVLNGTMSDEEILKWQLNYELLTKEEAGQSLQFIRKYRSYVICYNYGEDLVRNYVASRSQPPGDESRWTAYGWLLCNMVTPPDLLQQ